MEIKNLDRFSQINDAKRKQEASAAIPASSFLSMMQNRIKTEEVGTAVSGPREIASDGLGLYRLSEVEAISARSRIQYANTGDVSDFLGLIGAKPYLLDGANLDGLDEGVIKTLSAEQAAILGQNYNVDNLSQTEQYALFSELAALGALSKSDVQKTQLSVSPKPDDLMGYLTGESGFLDVSAISETDTRTRLSAMIQNERLVYDHVKERYGKNCDAVSQLADSHSRTLDVLNKLKGGA